MENGCHGFLSTEPQVFYQCSLIDPAVALGCGAKASTQHLVALLQRPPPREKVAPDLRRHRLGLRSSATALGSSSSQEEKGLVVEHTDSLPDTPRRSLRSTECSRSSASNTAKNICRGSPSVQSIIYVEMVKKVLVVKMSSAFVRPARLRVQINFNGLPRQP